MHVLSAALAAAVLHINVVAALSLGADRGKKRSHSAANGRGDGRTDGSGDTDTILGRGAKRFARALVAPLNERRLGRGLVAPDQLLVVQEIGDQAAPQDGEHAEMRGRIVVDALKAPASVRSVYHDMFMTDLRDYSGNPEFVMEQTQLDFEVVKQWWTLHLFLRSFRSASALPAECVKALRDLKLSYSGRGEDAVEEYRVQEKSFVDEFSLKASVLGRPQPYLYPQRLLRYYDEHFRQADYQLGDGPFAGMHFVGDPRGDAGPQDYEQVKAYSHSAAAADFLRRALLVYGVDLDSEDDAMFSGARERQRDTFAQGSVERLAEGFRWFNDKLRGEDRHPSRAEDGGGEANDESDGTGEAATAATARHRARHPRFSEREGRVTENPGHYFNGSLPGTVGGAREKLKLEGVKSAAYDAVFGDGVADFWRWFDGNSHAWSGRMFGWRSSKTSQSLRLNDRWSGLAAQEEKSRLDLACEAGAKLLLDAQLRPVLEEMDAHLRAELDDLGVRADWTLAYAHFRPTGGDDREAARRMEFRYKGSSEFRKFVDEALGRKSAPAEKGGAAAECSAGAASADDAELSVTLKPADGSSYTVRAKTVGECREQLLLRLGMPAGAAAARGEMMRVHHQFFRGGEETALADEVKLAQLFPSAAAQGGEERTLFIVQGRAVHAIDINELRAMPDLLAIGFEAPKDEECNTVQHVSHAVWQNVSLGAGFRVRHITVHPTAQAAAADGALAVGEEVPLEVLLSRPWLGGSMFKLRVHVELVGECRNGNVEPEERAKSRAAAQAAPSPATGEQPSPAPQASRLEIEDFRVECVPHGRIGMPARAEVGGATGRLRDEVEGDVDAGRIILYEDGTHRYNAVVPGLGGQLLRIVRERGAGQ